MPYFSTTFFKLRKFANIDNMKEISNYTQKYIDISTFFELEGSLEPLNP